MADEDVISLDPPRPPSDLIASALLLPLHEISTAHRGRKLRFLGQVLAFHPPSSLLLLTSATRDKPLPTILVNVSIPLLGPSGALKDVSSAGQGVFSRHSTSHTASNNTSETGGLVNRERLRLDRGEWVCVVGWLEGEDERLIKKITAPSSYSPPLPIVLEAIFISPARAPPHVQASQLEDMPIVDIDLSMTQDHSVGQLGLHDGTDENQTPQPKRRR